MTKIISIISFALVALLVAPRPTDAQSTPAFRVIVNAKNPVSRMSRGDVGKLFLKKTSSWPDDTSVVAVDQAVSSSVREAFSRQVHGKSARAIKQYWNQQIYSGRAVPPSELGSDAKVVAFVLANPGAIGYVSAAAAIGDAKLLTVD